MSKQLLTRIDSQRVDFRRIDSHCHLWRLSRGDYHWMDQSDPALKPIARDFEFDDLADVHVKNGVASGVLVQAAASEAETEFLLSIAEENSQILGVVGWVDLESDHANDRLTEFSNNSLFKGIRPMLQDIEETNWLVDAPSQDVWSHLVGLGLCFDALVKPRHLSMIHEFCLDHADLPIVIDHVAKPQFGTSDKDELADTYKAIGKIGSQTHAHCKMSGLLTEMAPAQLDDAYEILKPLIDLLLETFGPERMMWGSDWPVVRLAGGYRCWNDLTHKLLQDVNSASRDAILGQTACEFYGLGERQS